MEDNSGKIIRGGFGGIIVGLGAFMLFKEIGVMLRGGGRYTYTMPLTSHEVTVLLMLSISTLIILCGMIMLLGDPDARAKQAGEEKFLREFFGAVFVGIGAFMVFKEIGMMNYDRRYYTYEFPLSSDEASTLLRATIFSLLMFFGTSLACGKSTSTRNINSSDSQTVQRKSIVCPGCKTKIPTDTSICPQCGFHIRGSASKSPTASSSDSIVCPFCKHKYPQGTVFCGKCGAQIGAQKVNAANNKI